MRQLLLIFSLISYYAFLVSCNSASQQKFEFYYYPSRNVYFDLSNNNYLFSLDGGQTWDSVKAISSGEPSTLGAKQVVYSESPSVWIDNAEHRREFSGQLVDITKTDSGTTDKELAAERPVKKAASTTKKPEKKLNFFQRLFGKKNK